MKRQFLYTFVAVIISYLMCVEKIEANYNWNWDSGTTEGWMDASAGTIVSIEDGRNGTFGLGVQQPTPYVGAVYPRVKIEDQFIDPGSLVGSQQGEYLAMTGEIYVDVNREMSASHGNYVDLWIYGENSKARFVCYPEEGDGRIEDIGNGWFRHYLENRLHTAIDPTSERIGSIYLNWNWNYNATSDPVVFDNFTIVPEPISLLLFGLGGLILRRRKT
jgi:hypothetical protein